MDPFTTDSPDLLASTGLNDPNSPWNLNGLLQTGINFGNQELQAALASQTPLTAPTSGNGAPASQTPVVGNAFSNVAPGKATSWTTVVVWVAVVALVGWVLLE